MLNFSFPAPLPSFPHTHPEWHKGWGLGDPAITVPLCFFFLLMLPPAPAWVLPSGQTCSRMLSSTDHRETLEPTAPPPLLISPKYLQGCSSHSNPSLPVQWFCPSSNTFSRGITILADHPSHVLQWIHQSWAEPARISTEQHLRHQGEQSSAYQPPGFVNPLGLGTKLCMTSRWPPDITRDFIEAFSKASSSWATRSGWSSCSLLPRKGF